MGDKLEVKRGRGRPKKNDGYRNHFNIRLSDDEFDRLENCAVRCGMTLSDTVREALRAYDVYLTIMEKYDNSKK